MFFEDKRSDKQAYFTIPIKGLTNQIGTMKYTYKKEEWWNYNALRGFMVVNTLTVGTNFGYIVIVSNRE